MTAERVATAADPRFVIDGPRPRCTPRNAWLFVPAPKASDRDKRAYRIALAKGVCRTCPLKAACLEFGQAGRESGVWGGEYLSYGKVMYRARA